MRESKAVLIQSGKILGLEGIAQKARITGQRQAGLDQPGPCGQAFPGMVCFIPRGLKSTR